MIALSATDSLHGVAATAGAISYSILGDTIVGGADQFGLIAQGLLTASAAAIVPASGVRLVKAIFLSNTTGGAVAGIKLYVNGSAAANQIVTLTIPANGSAKFDSAGWALYDSTGSVLSAGLAGRGITSIALTAGNGAAGTTDTYTITYSDATTSTFTVVNGANGTNGQSVAVLDEGASLTGAAASLNFTGAGVSATAAGSAVTVTIAGYTDEQAQDAVGAAFAAGTGDGATVTYDDGGNRFVVENTDKGSAAVATHEAAADPHPQYTTTTELNAAGTSLINSHTAAPDPHPQYKPLAATIVAPTAAASTAAQTVATLTIPANTLVAGSSVDCSAILATIINTTAASNLVIDILVNGAVAATTTAALGTTAVATPGRGARFDGTLTFRTVGATGTAIAGGRTTVNNLASFASNQTATVAVNTTAAVTIAIRVATSATTSTFTIQQARVAKVH